MKMLMKFAVAALVAGAILMLGRPGGVSIPGLTQTNQDELVADGENPVGDTPEEKTLNRIFAELQVLAREEKARSKDVIHSTKDNEGDLK